MKSSLPDNVHLLTLTNDFDNASGKRSVLVRFEHFYEIGEDVELSQPASFDLEQTFNGTFSIVSVDELALGANMDVSELSERLVWSSSSSSSSKPEASKTRRDKRLSDPFIVTLDPMQIRTFRLWLS